MENRDKRQKTVLALGYFDSVHIGLKLQISLAVNTHTVTNII